MVGFKSFLTSDVGIFPTKILNVGAAISGRFLVPEKLAEIINDGGGSCFIIPDIPRRLPPRVTRTKPLLRNA